MHNVAVPRQHPAVQKRAAGNVRQAAMVAVSSISPHLIFSGTSATSSKASSRPSSSTSAPDANDASTAARLYCRHKQQSKQAGRQAAQSSAAGIRHTDCGQYGWTPQRQSRSTARALGLTRYIHHVSQHNMPFRRMEARDPMLAAIKDTNHATLHILPPAGCRSLHHPRWPPAPHCRSRSPRAPRPRRCDAPAGPPPSHRSTQSPRHAHLQAVAAVTT